MPELLDLFDDDEPAPDPAPAESPTPRAPPPVAPPPPPPPPAPPVAPRHADVKKPAPTYRLHLCVAPGCYQWGGFGVMGQDIAHSTWYCGEHVPPGFFSLATERKI